MNYSLLIYQSNSHSLDAFLNDSRCKEIIQLCTTEELMTNSAKPQSKTLYVPFQDSLYTSIFNGLKGVTQEDVIVSDGKTTLQMQDIYTLLKYLNQWPAIQYKDAAYAFDTRLLMFSLQKALESNQDLSDCFQTIDMEIKTIE